jgi:DNA processing protein
MSLTTPDLALVLALYAQDGIGARTITRWLQWLGGQRAHPSDFAGRPHEELAAALPGGSDRLSAALVNVADDDVERAARHVARVQQAGAQFYTVTEADYPPSLLGALGPSAPPVLTILGDAELFARDAGGVVGSRAPSESGTTLAGLCTGWLVKQGRVTVSGGAQGVDTAAHSAALEAGGSTVVVLPQGLLTYRASAALATAIEEGRAVLVSQFLPDAAWSVGAAVARNETIAALSRLVCIIEPGSPGGSAKTGQDALNQGKPALVYAGVDARGTGRALLQAGAKPLLGPAGPLSEEYLESVWQGAPVVTTEQQHLF